MIYDESKIDDTVLALLATFSFEGGRAWKGFDFDVMDRLSCSGLHRESRQQEQVGLAHTARP